MPGLLRPADSVPALVCAFMRPGIASGANCKQRLLLGDAEDDDRAVVLEGIATAVAHGLQDGHSASRCCSAFDALDGSADPVQAESPTGLRPPLGDAVRDEDEPLAGGHLTLR